MRKSEIKEEGENIQDMRRTLLPEQPVEKKRCCKQLCLVISLMGLSSAFSILSILLYQHKHCIHDEEHFLCYDTLMDGSN